MYLHHDKIVPAGEYAKRVIEEEKERRVMDNTDIEYPYLTGEEVRDGCGAGTENCCIYITAGPGGLSCAKASPSMKLYLDMRFETGTMSATRQPTEEYPECQIKS